jgi:phosphoenolpyruvate carboxylase
MSEANYTTLKSNVSMLGRLLGETMTAAHGDAFLELVERIRGLSKRGQDGDSAAAAELRVLLRDLPREQLVSVARAFCQFLNMANIADQQNNISREMNTHFSASRALAREFNALLEEGIQAEALAGCIDELNIELVLTAHPTEIMRRTLIHKHTEIQRCLGKLELGGYTERETEQLATRLQELISQIWFGDDFRDHKPTPVDEARWGFAVVEDSLWSAVPEFCRRLDEALANATGKGLPLQAAPVHFVSWMGGDRDGNPNVTAEVTQEVLLLSRWQAASLYLADIEHLVEELSMTAASAALKARVPDAHEPYREVLRPLRQMLRHTLAHLEAELEGASQDSGEILAHCDQLWLPIRECYESLLECGMSTIANGATLDLLRKIRCFGVHLVRHDVRQHSDRHMQVFSELTRELQLGDYAQWSEQDRQAFLLRELDNRRPLFPVGWQSSADVQEVIDTCRVVGEQPCEALGCYIISMARQPSDVLAVQLLLKECGCDWPLPVTPLFETLDDLSRARDVVAALLEVEGYRERVQQRMTVMIGYSDSAKDAGMLAAAWAQYRAQEELVALCEQEGVQLTLFHGRGGTIGRGGAPAHDALLSQPPGSLKNGLRVTEQGEMIRTKLGWVSLAVKTLALYTTAICRANLSTPPSPRPEWRAMMERLSAESCDAYRSVVFREDDFVDYFRAATPEQELGRLPLGSRPTRRGGGVGVESLRAIPWIFAWSQNRLMLPAWLGAGAAMRAAIERGEADTLQQMARAWPFFATRLSMLEMVFAKADGRMSAYYEELLVDPSLHHLGDSLRAQLEADRDTMLELNGHGELLEDQPWIRESIRLRNIYTEPLNLLQAELLQRQRAESDPVVERAIMVTIAGISAGLRNTG